MNKNSKSKKEAVKEFFKTNLFYIFICIFMTAVTVTNIWVAQSIINMHNVTMKFISDVFYYVPEAGTDTTSEGNSSDTGDVSEKGSLPVEGEYTDEETGVKVEIQEEDTNQNN